MFGLEKTSLKTSKKGIYYIVEEERNLYGGINLHWYGRYWYWFVTLVYFLSLA
jgi:hypothetical protein